MRARFPVADADAGANSSRTGGRGSVCVCNYGHVAVCACVRYLSVLMCPCLSGRLDVVLCICNVRISWVNGLLNNESLGRVGMVQALDHDADSESLQVLTVSRPGSLRHRASRHTVEVLEKLRIR